MLLNRLALFAEKISSFIRSGTPAKQSLHGNSENKLMKLRTRQWLCHMNSFLVRNKPALSLAGCVVLRVACALWFVNYAAAPASAAFFTSAETFLTNNFAGAGAAIALTANALRALLIIYVAVSLVSVINKLRQDEDWQSASRTPIVIVLAVTIMDVLSGVIAG